MGHECVQLLDHSHEVTVDFSFFELVKLKEKKMPKHIYMENQDNVFLGSRL